MRLRMQYRSRCVHGILFEPDHASMIIRNKPGRHYLIHGLDTRLITGFDTPLDAPDTMGYGIYHEADRPNTMWIRDRTGLRRIQGTPATPLERDAPWTRVATRIPNHPIPSPYA